MRSFTHFLIAVLISACVSPQVPSAPLVPSSHPDVQVTDGLPTPLYEAPTNWQTVTVEESDDLTVIAEVALERPEMEAIMYLAVVDAGDQSLVQHAQLARADLAVALPDSVVSEVGAGLAGPGEVVFVARWPVTSHPNGTVYRTKAIFRTIPGDPGHYAFCSGSWPEAANEFLLAPLHEACQSVRLPM